MEHKNLHNLEDLAGLFKAMADPTRLKLIHLLMINNENELLVIEIADKIGISQPAITQHINVLKALNLIQVKKDKNKKIYSIDHNQFEKYRNFIIQSMDQTTMRCNFKGPCKDCPNNTSK